MNCNDEVTSLDVRLRENGGAGSSQHAGEASGSSAADDESNLYPHILQDQVFGLNLALPEAAKLPIKPWHLREDTERYAESQEIDDAEDEEEEEGTKDAMVITIPFTCSVRIKSILLKTGRGDFAPTVSVPRCVACNG